LSRVSSLTPTLDGTSSDEKREEIRDYFQNTFTLFEKVFELLADESVFYQKSEKTRHPMIFYYGHTATFFINKLISMKIIQERINPKFESLFAVGVDEMFWDELDDGLYQWPSLEEVKAYRKRVFELVSKLIMNLPLVLPIEEESAMWVVLMGIEHERIHIETSLVLHRQMPLDAVVEHALFPLCPESAEAKENSMVAVEGGEVELAANPKEYRLYGWDNEYGESRKSVDDFLVSKYLVSNGEYLAFVESGGYEKEEYWDEEGREFLQRSEILHPPFWVKKEGKFLYRTLSKEIPMPLNWPVEVNALEAEAFCRYKSQKESQEYVLPSEVEHRLLYERGAKGALLYDETRANVNFAHFSSSMPVDSFAFTLANGESLYDIVGNVWQWSRTPIEGFKGFKVHPAYDDFSVPTFDTKHNIILGASWASSGNLITKHSRYAFRRHFYQNAGFRYVISETKEEREEMYESDTLVSQYCEFQYGENYFGVENFAQKTVAIAKKFITKKEKALDLGCATGRASFELAKDFEHVDGIDFSVRFIQVGTQLQKEGTVRFSSAEEGELVTPKEVKLSELGYEDVKEKISFLQGDACNLKPHISGYDLVIATNLIDRLYNPYLFLESIAQRMNEGATLVLTSPYTWQESSTKKELWLGGYKDENGEEVHTIETLKRLLSSSFELVHIEDVEFVIKESARKFQHTIAELSVWKKR